MFWVYLGRAWFSGLMDFNAPWIGHFRAASCLLNFWSGWIRACIVSASTYYQISSSCPWYTWMPLNFCLSLQTVSYDSLYYIFGPYIMYKTLIIYHHNWCNVYNYHDSVSWSPSSWLSSSSSDSDDSGTTASKSCRKWLKERWTSTLRWILCALRKLKLRVKRWQLGTFPTISAKANSKSICSWPISWDTPSASMITLESI